ncbi:LCP family protein [Micromonospora sp. CPCC 205556]|uniref:LCP family protein n=1 Tax=Micromonospora sp. CPCC 205556 TaxID=3122398 RepID=UPI002FF3C5B7
MTEEELRAAFARQEPSIPPVGPLRAAIDRIAARRRRRRNRLRAGGAALAVLGLLGVAVPQVVPPVGERAATGNLTGDPGGRSDALNVLLLGLDGTPRAHAAGSTPRADAVLLVHVPADRSRIWLVSMPRDLLVKIPGHGTAKLNTAFAQGAGQPRPDLRRGYELTERTVTGVTGLPIDAGSALTYPALGKLTDGVGGVEVCLPGQVRSTHTRRTFPAGCQRLDGAGAVDLLRQRRDLPNGARDRDRNVQRYLAGLLRQLDERELRTNPAALGRLLAGIGADLTVDTGGRSLPDLLALAGTATSAAPVGVALPTVEDRERLGTSLLDRGAAPAFLAALREDRLDEWAAANPERVTPLAPQR